MQQLRKTSHDNQIKPHMTTSLFFRRENIEALPPPCCVPTQFQPLTVLYFHTGERLCFVVNVYVFVNIDVFIDADVVIDVDIYIMMQFCLSVTKNDHFLKRHVCLSVCLFVRFILTSLKVESGKWKVESRK